ncbi:hypothetical protein EUX98_g2295 [Antrodiella citrinella]|uniref:Uncharacterized protein n=1 Tax=Antrodiella citrinella TaxID=2447956 RepID=A0A4S4N0W6_9APHY|nr:hypothetical protein EUX98_g2295 [Antrodiella citrinella]
MRDALAQYEQANETGLQNYSEQQELLKRIEMGREAERQLSQMMTAAGNVRSSSSVFLSLGDTRLQPPTICERVVPVKFTRFRISVASKLVPSSTDVRRQHTYPIAHKLVSTTSVMDEWTN